MLLESLNSPLIFSHAIPVLGGPPSLPTPPLSMPRLCLSSSAPPSSLEPHWVVPDSLEPTHQYKILQTYVNKTKRVRPLKMSRTGEKCDALPQNREQVTFWVKLIFVSL